MVGGFHVLFVLFVFPFSVVGKNMGSVEDKPELVPS